MGNASLNRCMGHEFFELVRVSTAEYYVLLEGDRVDVVVAQLACGHRKQTCILRRSGFLTHCSEQDPRGAVGHVPKQRKRWSYYRIWKEG